jgi:hypothetical protein
MTDPNFQELLQWTRLNVEVAAASLHVDLSRLWAEELAKPRHADPKRLLRFGFKVYSQNDEDGIIQEIFKRIGTTNRTFVEFGVETGIESNTTKLLVEGWRGLWIDALPIHVAAIRKTLAHKLVDGTLKVKESFVTVENINALIAESGIGGEIDILSIDIDYNDYWVWKAITTVDPRVVVIEYNATLRPPMSLVVPYSPNQSGDGSNFFGASLEAFVKLGRDMGYSLVGCNFSGSNAFFVRNDLVGEHFLQPATAEEHYEPARYFFSNLPSGHRSRPGPFLAV